MNIYIERANPHKYSEGFFHQFIYLAKLDIHHKHNLVFDPKLADCILFIDAHYNLDLDYLSIVSEHQLTKKYADKVFLYNEYDRPHCGCRGIVVSMPKGLFKRNQHRAVCYATNPMDPHSEGAQITGRTRFCFFAGGSTHNPTRQRIIKQLKNSLVDIVDTSDVSPWITGVNAPSAAQRHKSMIDYKRKLEEYQYCLAPRGKGTASFRLFEAMAMGSVPIVMSDAYVQPAIPDWDDAVVTFAQTKPKSVITNYDKLVDQHQYRQNGVIQMNLEYFSHSSRWNFFGNELELLLGHNKPWTKPSKQDDLLNRTYWMLCRAIKRLEGYSVNLTFDSTAVQSNL